MKTVFRLGSTWILQLILSIAMLAFAVMALAFGLKKDESTGAGRKALSQDEINARVAAIKALGNTETKRGKKSKTADIESNFNRLLA